MKTKAIIVIDGDDHDVYFLVINQETGKEIERYSTTDFGLFRYHDEYREAKVIDEIVARHDLEIVNKIYWGL